MSAESLVEAVRAGRTGEAVRLLADVPDAGRRACLPALKELRKEVRADPWGARARKVCPALHAVGAACHTGAAAAATWIAASDMRWNQAGPGTLLHVLGGRDPRWLGDLVHRLAARPASAAVPYELMAGLVRLAGCPVPTTDAYVQGWVEHVSGVWQTGGTVADRLRRDPHVAELVAALCASTEALGQVVWMFGDGPDPWPPALARLTREGVLDRKVMVDACVARLLRGGAPSEQRAFLRLLECLDLTPEERRERCADWTALAADALSTVAAHAQSVLGALALDGELTPRQLAETSTAVLFRSEKKLVRAQLVLLGKVLRRDASAAAELLPAAAEAFGHEDTEVQERALKLVGRHLDALPARAREEVTALTDRLSPGLRAGAAELLGTEVPAAGQDAYEEILPPAPEPVRLAPPPRTAAEVAEEVSALLASGGDVATFERALDGLARHAHRDREALAEALEPVVARRWWAHDDMPRENVEQYFRDRSNGVEVVVASLLGSVRTGALIAATHRGHSGDRCVHSALTRPYDARMRELAYRVRTDPPPFLLATPTWGSGLLEPEELAGRLEEYRALGARAGEADFAQALLRVRRDDPGAAARAAERAAALGTPEGERLARWLTATAPLLPTSGRRTLGNRISVEFGELLDLQQELPEEFRQLGRPLYPFSGSTYCWHWDQDEQRHWAAVLPGHRELLAGRVLRDVSGAVVDASAGAASILPLLAEAEGPAGEATHLCLAYGLGSRHSGNRLSAVDALLVLAARGQLDAERLGTDLGELMDLDTVKPSRLADALRTAASTGACATVWAILRAALPAPLAGLAAPADAAVPASTAASADTATSADAVDTAEAATPAAGTTAARSAAAAGSATAAVSTASAAPPRGLGDLLAVAAECAERTGARGHLPHLDRAADRRGSSRLVAQARRLRTALTLPPAA